MNFDDHHQVKFITKKRTEKKLEMITIAEISEFQDVSFSDND